MEEDDYSVALKLQQQFDSEYQRDSLKNNAGTASGTHNSRISSPSMFSRENEFDDFNLALQLQEIENDANEVVFCGQSETKNKSSNLADISWELVDPNPDVFRLFVEFDKKFFWGKLASVEIIWSTRMTLCAGVCEYHGKRSGACCIKLSEPLLKLRPRKDLVETLLHEMIHAYLFLTNNDRDRDGHGPNFQSHMYRLNKETGLNITIYHNFHDEVALYQQHWWRCDGPCRTKQPFYGYVKRSMNRAPSSNDTWWSSHQATCGGTFAKIKEPENFATKKGQTSSTSGKQVFINNSFKDSNLKTSKAPISNSFPTPKPKTNISTFSKVNDKEANDDEMNSFLFKSTTGDAANKSTGVENAAPTTSTAYFTGSGYKLGSSSSVSSMSKVLKELHEERLTNRNNKELTDSITTDKYNSESNFHRDENSGSKKQQNKEKTDPKVLKQSNYTTLEKFFTVKTNTLGSSSNQKSSAIVITDKTRDKKSILSDASLEVGAIVWIPNFISVSDHKHYKSKYASYFNNPNKDSELSVNELKRKYNDSDCGTLVKKFGRFDQPLKNKSLNTDDSSGCNNNIYVETADDIVKIRDETKMDDDDSEMCAFASKCEEEHLSSQSDSVQPKCVSNMGDEKSFDSPECVRKLLVSSSPITSPCFSPMKLPSENVSRQPKFESPSTKKSPVFQKSKITFLTKSESRMRMSKLSPITVKPFKICPTLPSSNTFCPSFGSMVHGSSPLNSRYSNFHAHYLPHNWSRYSNNWPKFKSFNSPFAFPRYPYFPTRQRSSKFQMPYLTPSPSKNFSLFRPKQFRYPLRYHNSFRSFTSSPLFPFYPNFSLLARSKRMSFYQNNFAAAAHKSKNSPTLYLNLHLPVFCSSPSPSESSLCLLSPSSSSPASSRPSSPSPVGSGQPSTSGHEQLLSEVIKQSFSLNSSTSCEHLPPTVESLLLNNKENGDNEDEYVNDDEDDYPLSSSISLLHSPSVKVVKFVSCPVCKLEFKIELINHHLDECLKL